MVRGGVVWSGERRPGASALATASQVVQTKGGYRIWLIAPVATVDGEIQESQELGSVWSTQR
eukprot:767972-Prorocentrum_minimum.AAC.1